jgi:hypothetical protein
MTRLRQLLLALLLAVLLAPPALAQKSKKLHFGVTGGINFATWRGSDVGPGATRRTGFHAGGVVTNDLSEAFSIQTGLVYSQEGSGANLGGGVTGSINVDYLRVPLLLKAATTLRGTTPIRPYLYAGPAVSFKVHCRVTAKSGTQSAAADCTDPSLSLQIRSTDVSADFGAGVDIGRVTLGGRYQLGFRSVDGTSASSDVKNSVFAITAGFRF